MARKQVDEVKGFVRKVALFGGLEGARLDSVLSVLGEDTFPVGEVLFKEGELGRTLFVVLEGEVEVLRHSADGKEISIVKLGPGEVFGEMALVELQPRSATVRVTKKLRALSLTNPDLYALYKGDTYAYVLLLQNICRMLSRRLRKADSRIADFLASSQAPKKASRGQRN